MKQSLYFLLGALLLCGMYQACAPEELPGSIYGTVVDEATGEPIKSAGVELNPVGLKTVTGDEGQFEFTELESGKYTLLVTKTGYMDGFSHSIEVKPGQKAKGDVQIEKLPPALKVVNGNSEEISILDFGSAEDDVIRSFSLFNDGPSTLEWQLTFSANWIKSVNKTMGSLSAGDTEAMLITIDRSKLNSGENKTTIHFTSNSGNKQLAVIATNDYLPTTLNMLTVTEIRSTSATFNGEIITDGTPKYTQRGFVYAKESTPTIENSIAQLTCPLTNDKAYSTPVSGLTDGTTYYVRAYAAQAGKTVYSSNEVSFVATANTKLSVPTVTTTSPTNISYTSATVGGNVTSDGGATITERGVCYSISTNPTTSDHVEKSGTGVGNYTVDLYGLSDGTTYYVRAYAINEKGISYGEEKSFTTLQYGKPSVTTNIATNIDYTSATVGGNVTADGGSTVTERGVCYSTSTSNPTILDNIKSSGRGMGSFTVNLTGLSSGATYYVRAYATNVEGTSYGEIIQFTTKVLTYEAIDMGLSVKWATFNVGATKPEEYGDYFAWGEIQPKDYYDWSTYKWCNGSYYNLTKYSSNGSYGVNDYKNTLEAADDAATANWGTNWRMPTYEEVTELLEQCTWSWTLLNGVSGYQIVSKINGKSIFLPAAGRISKGSTELTRGSGFYWTKTLYKHNPDYAMAIYFVSDFTSLDYNEDWIRYLGFPIRPVCQ